MKERLTGAIILVALIVLLVPELLTGPLRSKPAGNASRAAAAPTVSTADAASSKGQTPVRSYTLDLTSSATARSAAKRTAPAKRTAGEGVPKPSGAGAPAPSSTAGRSPPRSPSSNATLQTAARIVPRPKAKVASHGREHALARPASRSRAAVTPSRHRPQSAARWVVQLASFSRHANASRLARRLRRRHFTVTVAPLRLRGRLWWRVWVGPVRDRAAAQRLARRLRPTGLRGEVLRE